MAVIQWVNAVAFTLLGIVSLRLAVQRPSGILAWAAVSFLSIDAILVVALFVPSTQPGGAAWQIVIKFLVTLLVIFPWSLYRFARAISKRSKRVTSYISDGIAAILIALALFGVNWQLFWTLPRSAARDAFIVAFIGYLCIMPAIAGAKLLWSSRSQSTIVGKRLRLLATASLLLAAGLVLSFTRLGSGAPGLVHFLVQCIGLVSAIMFVLALAAPKALRRYWNMSNESAINSAIGEIISYSSADDSIQRLLPPIAAACGSEAAAFFAGDGGVRAVFGITPGVAIERRRMDEPERYIEQPLSNGSIVVWTNELWPFPSDDGKQMLVNVGGILDLIVSRRDADEMRHQLEIRTRVEQSLREQAGELERVNAELNQFVAVASHDLQAPMRNIIDYVDFLRQDIGTDLSANADEDMHFITTAASRMRELIEALLSYTRVGSAAIPLTQRINVGEVVETSLQTLASAINDVDGIVETGPMPTIQGDPTTLTQLFVNLIENCVKYRSPQRPLRVTIKSFPHQDSTTYSITDNGEGVAAEFHTRIFTMFKRLHTDDDIPGTGIGLAICQRIVERHGGNIWVQESSDNGTTICFTLQNRHDPGRQPYAPASLAGVREADHLVG